MSEPFTGQISIFSFGFAPRNYATCDGQILQISQNQALFSLLGTTYGGNGTTTFALPDLRGRAPVQAGTVIAKQGQSGGEEAHLLQMNEMPWHRHDMMASGTPGNAPVPQGAVLAASANTPYSFLPPAPPTLVKMNPDTIPSVGGTAHDNMQPFLTINFAICLFGIFPPKS